MIHFKIYRNENKEERNKNFLKFSDLQHNLILYIWDIY